MIKNARLRPVDASILRAPARKVHEDPVAAARLEPIVGSLLRTMHALGGAGLAAPQIGIGLRIAVAEIRPFNFVLVDPTYSVLGKPADRIEAEEGCLSLPGRLFRVKRYPAVRVHSHLNPEYPLTYIARGWMARVIQHELDHLDGVLVDQAGEEIKEAA